MRFLIFALLSMILLFSSCQEKKPSGIISEKKMTSLLEEVHILDGYLQTLPHDSAQKIIDTLYVQLLAKYELDTAGFSNNVNFYYANPTKTSKMYETIANNLRAKEQEVGRIDSVYNVRQRDSINRVYRQQRLLQYRSNLYNVTLDSTYTLDIEKYRNFIYEPSGLQWAWPAIAFPKGETPTGVDTLDSAGAADTVVQAGELKPMSEQKPLKPLAPMKLNKQEVPVEVRRELTAPKN